MLWRLNATAWSSQDSVDTLPACFVNGFKLLWAESSEMAVTPGAIVERVDVVSDICDREVSVLIDLFFDSLLLQAAEEGLGDRIVPAVALSVMLGSR